MIDVLKAQLLALRTQVDAMLAVLDTVTPAAVLEQSCNHPETENVGTFGAPEYRCTVCKAMISVPAG